MSRRRSTEQFYSAFQAVQMNRPDAHGKPPESLRAFYKTYQNISISTLDRDEEIVDFLQEGGGADKNTIHFIRSTQSSSLPAESLILADHVTVPPEPQSLSPLKVFGHCDFPGLEIIPSLLSPQVQRNLLSRLLHRDLANEQHTTNIHTHYQVPYELSRPETPIALDVPGEEQSCDANPSFFRSPPSSTLPFKPLSPEIHKPLSITQVLQRKLRWITLGGQYDWTRKSYPPGAPPAFPEDIRGLVHSLFPNMRPEAAIVNIYTPGDTLSLHRDVSEEADEGLVSISLGCDGLFVVGMDEKPNSSSHHMVIRLRSGDAIYMSGPSRHAWHGVPKIIPRTCPKWLEAWPASQLRPGEASKSKSMDGVQAEGYEAWRGWMATKRVNLNVRQMSNRPYMVGQSDD